VSTRQGECDRQLNQRSCLSTAVCTVSTTGPSTVFVWRRSDQRVRLFATNTRTSDVNEVLRRTGNLPLFRRRQVRWRIVSKYLQLLVVSYQFVFCIYSVSQKTGPLRLISHKLTLSIHSIC